MGLDASSWMEAAVSNSKDLKLTCNSQSEKTLKTSLQEKKLFEEQEDVEGQTL